MAAARDRQGIGRPSWTKDRVLDELARRPLATTPPHLARAATRHFGSLAAARDAVRWRAHQRSLRSLVEAVLDMSVEDKLDFVQRMLIRAAVTVAGGNRTEAARILGVHRKTVERRCTRTTRTQAGARPLAHLVAAVLEMAVDNKLDEIERAMLLAAIARARGNKSETARILGVHRKIVERRLAR